METVSQEIGVGVATRERGRSKALLKPTATRTWTAAARLEAVIMTAPLDESRQSAGCREKGLYPAEVEQWRQSAAAALAESEQARATPQATRQAPQRIQELEREVNKALAETTALLGLSKKLSAVFGEGEDA